MISDDELTEKGMNWFYYRPSAVFIIEIHSSIEFLSLSRDQRRNNVIFYPEKDIALWYCYSENNECIRKWGSPIPKNKGDIFIWRSIEKI